MKTRFIKLNLGNWPLWMKVGLILVIIQLFFSWGIILPFFSGDYKYLPNFVSDIILTFLVVAVCGLSYTLGIKLKEKNMPYWLIGSLVSTFIFISNFLIVSSPISNETFSFLFVIIFAFPIAIIENIISKPINFILSFIIVFLFWIVIGAIIGLIYVIIKNKNLKNIN